MREKGGAGEVRRKQKKKKQKKEREQKRKKEWIGGEGKKDKEEEEKEGGARDTRSPTWRLGFSHNDVPAPRIRKKKENLNCSTEISARKLGVNLWERGGESEDQVNC